MPTLAKLLTDKVKFESFILPHSSDIAYYDTTGRVIFWNHK